MEPLINFWDIHGFIFIFFMFFCPRLTMLIATSVLFPFNVLIFAGWLLVPRLTVAIIATTIYWHTNPALCVFTWIWALSGEACEKHCANRKANG